MREPDPKFLFRYHRRILAERTKENQQAARIARGGTGRRLDMRCRVEGCKNTRAATDLLIAGNDQAAKVQVTELSKSLGWKSILDLGDISNARGVRYRRRGACCGCSVASPC